MMPFEFRLQKLLEYRENQKKLEQEELARLQREVLAVQQELARLQDEEQRLLEHHQSRQGGNLNILGLIAMENYRCFLQRCHREHMEKLQKAGQALEQQRSVVMGAWRSCRVLSLLRENKQQNYLAEEKNTEQRLNDEMGLNAFMRRK